ncbi:MAG: hypothetical protein GZ085_04600 [Sulfuriferula multivorans]|uniref:Uncharacterized protein n=1 Tax=Sulfuriferula multivorans TaxID=1559896 RepID=A0A7C9P8D9_9PROT|nr:hypothetical protein [Sulfuriferula multivorans]
METSKNPVKFYGLLYISKKANDGAYLQRIDPQKRIELYFRMALRLAKGVHSRFGTALNLITNEGDEIATLLEKITGSKTSNFITIKQIEFPSSGIPEGARYFSATHKVMLFDYFSRQADYSVLLDIDMICLDGDSHPLTNYFENDIPLVYDISDQVFPAHGYARIFDDMQKFGQTDWHFRWYGGEFIAGSAGFFQELSERANSVLPRYTEIFASLHHQGDEMITSFCLNQMRACNSQHLPLDLSAPDIVRRHHGKATLHDERRFSRISKIGFLHLPTAKKLLSSNLADRTIVRVLSVAELLPRRIAGPFLAVVGMVV